MEKNPQTTEIQRERKGVWDSFVGITGAITSFVSSIVVSSFVEAEFKEKPSSWAALQETDGVLKSFWKGAIRIFDPKQWKSNVAGIAVFFGGLAATEWLVDRIYNRPSRNEISAIAHDAMEKTGTHSFLRAYAHATPEQRETLKNDWEKRVAERKLQEAETSR